MTRSTAHARTAAHQEYIRAEGLILFHRLPKDARQTLRYFETVSALRTFEPLPPLSGNAISAKGYYIVAVTDWSLFILSRSGGMKDGYQLEVPLLALKDLGMQEKDSDDILVPVDGKRFKTAVITCVPVVDTSRVPADQAAALARVREALRVTGGDDVAARKALEGKPYTTPPHEPQTHNRQPPSPVGPTTSDNDYHCSGTHHQPQPHFQQYQVQYASTQQQQRQSQWQPQQPPPPQQQQQGNQYQYAYNQQQHQLPQQQPNLWRPASAWSSTAAAAPPSGPRPLGESTEAGQQGTAWVPVLPWQQPPVYPHQQPQYTPSNQPQQPYPQPPLSPTYGAVSTANSAPWVGNQHVQPPSTPSPTLTRSLARPSRRATAPQPMYSSVPQVYPQQQQQYPAHGQQQYPQQYNQQGQVPPGQRVLQWPVPQHQPTHPLPAAQPGYLPAAPYPPAPPPQLLHTNGSYPDPYVAQTGLPGDGVVSTGGYVQPQAQEGMYPLQYSCPSGPPQVHRYRHSTGGVGSSAGTSVAHLGGQQYQQHRRPGDTRVPTPYLPPPPPLDLRSPILAPVAQHKGGPSWMREPEEEPMNAVDYVYEHYSLVFITLEHRSNLWHHVRLAWLGAHMRMALASERLPAVPLWYAPPPGSMHAYLATYLPHLLHQEGSSRRPHKGPEPGAQSPSVPRDVHAQLLQFLGYDSLTAAVQSAHSSALPLQLLLLEDAQPPPLPLASPHKALVQQHQRNRQRQVAAAALHDREARTRAVSSSAGAKRSLQFGKAHDLHINISAPPAGDATSNRGLSHAAPNPAGISAVTAAAHAGGYALTPAEDAAARAVWAGNVEDQDAEDYAADVLAGSHLTQAVLGDLGSSTLDTPPTPGVIPQPLLLARYQALVQRRMARQATIASAGRRTTNSDLLSGSAMHVPNLAPSLHPPQAAALHSTSVPVQHGAVHRGASVLPGSGHSTYTLTPRGNVTSQPQYAGVSGHHQQHQEGGWVTPEAAAQCSAAVQGMLGALELGATEEPSKAQVSGVFEEVEGVMSRGCSLFDDDDILVLKELMLESSVASPAKSRMYGQHFFRSRRIVAFLVARLYAWGAICGLYGRDLREVLPDGTVKKPLSPYVQWVVTRKARTFKGAGSTWGADMEAQPSAQAGSTAAVAGESVGVPATPWTAHATATAPAGVRPGSSGGGRPWDTPKYDYQGTAPPPSPSGYSVKLAAPWADTPATPASPASPARRAHRRPPAPWDSPEFGTPTTPAKPSASLHTSAHHQPRPPSKAAPGLHSPHGKGASVPDPYQTRGDWRPPVDVDRYTGRKASPEEEQYAFFLELYNMNSWRAHERSAHVPRLRRVLPRLGLACYTRTSINSTLRAVTEIIGVQARAREAQVLSMRSRPPCLLTEPVWIPGGSGGAAGRRARREAAYHNYPATMNTTKSSLAGSNPDRSSSTQRGAYSTSTSPQPTPRGGTTSSTTRHPPCVPPTLAPSDPLSLSPLAELPYLFALELPETVTASLGAGAGVVGGGGGHRDFAGMGGGAISGGMSALGVQAIHRQQARLQTSALGQALQAAYLDDYQGPSPGGGGEASTMATPAMERWEQLMGRLCAHLAWRKVRLTLSCLHGHLAFSEGIVERLGWLSEEVVESDPDLPHDLGVWTFARCTRHLVALMPQLRDPAGPGLLRQLLPPAGPGDLMWWAASEAVSPTLDNAVGCCWELGALSQQASAQGLYPASNVVADVFSELPPALVRAFNRRLFTRLSCLMVGSSMLGPTVQQQPLAGSGSTVPQQGGPHLHSVTGSTVGAGRRDATASPGLSDVVALRHCEVLLTLLHRLPGSAAALHDSVGDHVAHLLHLPRIVHALGAHRSVNPVLSRLVTGLYGELVSTVAAADPSTRPSTMWAAVTEEGRAPGLSQSTVANLGSVTTGFRMPGFGT